MQIPHPPPNHCARSRKNCFQYPSSQKQSFCNESKQFLPSHSQQLLMKDQRESQLGSFSQINDGCHRTQSIKKFDSPFSQPLFRNQREQKHNNAFHVNSKKHIRFQQYRDQELCEFIPQKKCLRPLVKLSIGLLNTCTLINRNYYKQKAKENKKKLKQKAIEDEEFSFLIQNLKKMANSRYNVMKYLGSGSFGVVVSAFDEIIKKMVAIKIIKRRFYKHAQTEIAILKEIQSDAQEWNTIVDLKCDFVHERHQCIVYELLPINLHELLRMYNFRGMPLNIVQNFANHLLITLQILSLRGIIHCDLKPENIMLQNSGSNEIKVIDFGSACWIGKRVHTYIQSRFYRAPEILLNIPYTCAIDMWSLGCILVELFTGSPLFPGKNEKDQICKQVQILGFPPNAMIRKSKKALHFFQPKNESQWQLKDSFGFSHRSLRSVIGLNLPEKHTNLMIQGKKKLDSHALLFEDLLLRMLDYNPETRISPSQALAHPFMTQQISPVRTANHLNNSYISATSIGKNIIPRWHIGNKTLIQSWVNQPRQSNQHKQIEPLERSQSWITNSNEINKFGQISNNSLAPLHTFPRGWYNRNFQQRINNDPLPQMTWHNSAFETTHSRSEANVCPHPVETNVGVSCNCLSTKNSHPSPHLNSHLNPQSRIPLNSNVLDQSKFISYSYSMPSTYADSYSIQPSFQVAINPYPNPPIRPSQYQPAHPYEVCHPIIPSSQKKIPPILQTSQSSTHSIQSSTHSIQPILHLHHSVTNPIFLKSDIVGETVDNSIYDAAKYNYECDKIGWKDNNDIENTQFPFFDQDYRRIPQRMHRNTEILQRTAVAR